MTNPATFADDLLEMMNAWNHIVAAARAEYPTATDEEIQAIATSAMNHALGL